MKLTPLAILLAAATAPALAEGARPAPASLTLRFETGPATGAVMVSLFDSKAAYAAGKPARQARVDIAKGKRTTVFAGLVAGRYAVKAFHDVDGNGRMNVNPFGLPTEPFAFSNNASANMGPAEWERAKLLVVGNTAQTIIVR